MKNKKVLYISLFLLVPILIFSTSIWVVYSKQKQLTQNVLISINKEFVGEITIEDSYISPFANFPYISIDLKGIKFCHSLIISALIDTADDRYIYQLRINVEIYL